MTARPASDRAMADVTALPLQERQRAITRICFAQEPPEDDLQKLGARDRWLLYRDLVRDRLRNMVKIALPRTVETIGERQFGRAFDAWLGEAPPRTRYIRDVVPEFVQFAVPRFRDEGKVRPWAGDLARYESACWQVRYAEDPDRSTLVDFDFDKVPVLNPALQVLRLDYPVHKKQKVGARYKQNPVNVCVYRDDSTFKPETWVLNDFAAELVRSWGSGEQTVTESVKQVAQARGTSIDQAFLEKLSSMLADFLRRGMVLGSRSP
jgi:hypothetical protein